MINEYDLTVLSMLCFSAASYNLRDTSDSIWWAVSSWWFCSEH